MMRTLCHCFLNVKFILHWILFSLKSTNKDIACCHTTGPLSLPSWREKSYLFLHLLWASLVVNASPHALLLNVCIGQFTVGKKRQQRCQGHFSPVGKWQPQRQRCKHKHQLQILICIYMYFMIMSIVILCNPFKLVQFACKCSENIQLITLQTQSHRLPNVNIP